MDVKKNGGRLFRWPKLTLSCSAEGRKEEKNEGRNKERKKKERKKERKKGRKAAGE
jgi:hypothetical protein